MRNNEIARSRSQHAGDFIIRTLLDQNVFFIS